MLKELVDNALDAGGQVSINQAGDDSYIVMDTGPGIDGTPEEIAHLFSIIRPSLSSKQWRLPTRGALGNGIRVAAGAVLVSDGRLVVTTRNRRHVLTPRDHGGTDVETTEVGFPVGTKIEITFGSTLPEDYDAMSWALQASNISAGAGPGYSGKTSPHWYDADAMFELLQGAGGRPVRELVAELDGCSGAKAGKIAADFLGTSCGALDRDQAVALLASARAAVRPVNHKRLGGVGRSPHLPAAYARKDGTFTAGGRSPKATIPFVVEAWASPTDAGSRASIYINRTPIADDTRARDAGKGRLNISILKYLVKVGRGNFEIIVNVTTPFCPLVDSGKRPDLDPFISEVIDAIESAVGKAKRANPSDRKRSQKDVVLENLAEMIDRASGGGTLPFKQRQLLYVMRPIVQRELEVELTEKNFNGIITDYENEHGEIPRMLRDPRGNMMHPHSGKRIPLGTETVAEYDRPEWNYNKLIYLEKEGFAELLSDSQWLERHDCAIASTKGFPGRSIRDLIDQLAEHDEPLRVFCVHDADASGSMIYQSLQYETRARGARKVEIIELGLNPWEAIGMGLEPEDVKYDKYQPVASYIKDREDGAYWERWLQTHRVELNAMTSPQFIAWLDQKMDEHSTGKVIPPDEHVMSCIQDEAETIIRERLTERILREAGLDDKVAAVMKDMKLPAAEAIQQEIEEYFEEHPTDSWKMWVMKTALDAANDNETEPDQEAS